MPHRTSVQNPWGIGDAAPYIPPQNAVNIRGYPFGGEAPEHLSPSRIKKSWTISALKCGRGLGVGLIRRPMPRGIHAATGETAGEHSSPLQAGHFLRWLQGQKKDRLERLARMLDAEHLQLFLV
ncbi:hypothetical protein SAMN05192585_10947 [Acetanaerobacterium elongatum]|uniref:Uncharacterized protein n=1 Tax=Acetanaerobacterium elongatum TaxID=258515 RepID=A0A1G9XU81_9FIRM|nr:hypothetical protein SAMN05192585_10947 [Acetanaerobacterium elongatum]